MTSWLARGMNCTSEGLTDRTEDISHGLVAGGSEGDMVAGNELGGGCVRLSDRPGFTLQDLCKADAGPPLNVDSRITLLVLTCDEAKQLESVEKLKATSRVIRTRKRSLVESSSSESGLDMGIGVEGGSKMTFVLCPTVRELTPDELAELEPPEGAFIARRSERIMETYPEGSGGEGSHDGGVVEVVGGGGGSKGAEKDKAKGKEPCGSEKAAKPVAKKQPAAVESKPTPSKGVTNSAVVVPKKKRGRPPGSSSSSKGSDGVGVGLVKGSKKLVSDSVTATTTTTTVTSYAGVTGTRKGMRSQGAAANSDTKTSAAASAVPASVDVHTFPPPPPPPATHILAHRLRVRPVPSTTCDGVHGMGDCEGESECASVKQPSAPTTPLASSRKPPCPPTRSKCVALLEPRDYLGPAPEFSRRRPRRLRTRDSGGASGGGGEGQDDDDRSLAGSIQSQITALSNAVEEDGPSFVRAHKKQRVLMGTTEDACVAAVNTYAPLKAPQGWVGGDGGGDQVGEGGKRTGRHTRGAQPQQQQQQTVTLPPTRTLRRGGGHMSHGGALVNPALVYIGTPKVVSEDTLQAGAA